MSGEKKGEEGGSAGSGDAGVGAGGELGSRVGSLVGEVGQRSGGAAAGGEMGSRVGGEVGAGGEVGSRGGGSVGDRGGSMVGEVGKRSGGGAGGGAAGDSGGSMVGEREGDSRLAQGPASRGRSLGVTQWGGGGDQSDERAGELGGSPVGEVTQWGVGGAADTRIGQWTAKAQSTVVVNRDALTYVLDAMLGCVVPAAVRDVATTMREILDRNDPDPRNTSICDVCGGSGARIVRCRDGSAFSICAGCSPRNGEPVQAPPFDTWAQEYLDREFGRSRYSSQVVDDIAALCRRAFDAAQRTETALPDTARVRGVMKNWGASEEMFAKLLRDVRFETIAAAARRLEEVASLSETPHEEVQWRNAAEAVRAMHEKPVAEGEVKP